MLDEKEEYEPAREGNRVLYHGPYAGRHHAFELRQIKLGSLIQSVFLSVATCSCVDDEEDHRDELRKAGTDGCSCDSHGRETEVSEDKYPVEENVGHYHDY